MSKTKLMPKRLITPSEAEAMYGIPTGSLANMRSQKRGPKYYKVGKRKVMYFVKDFETWLRSNPVLTLDSVDIK